MMITVHFKGRNINLHEPAARVAQNSPNYATYSSCHQPHDPMPLSCNHPHNILSPTFRVVRDWPLSTQSVAILLCWRHPSILKLGNVLFQYDFFLHVLTLARCNSFNLEITLTSGEEERELRDWRDGYIQFRGDYPYYKVRRNQSQPTQSELWRQCRDEKIVYVWKEMSAYEARKKRPILWVGGERKS